MPNCPVCKESRYKKKTKAGKLVAKKRVDTKHEFSGDARNVRLGLAADGFNPFGMMSPWLRQAVVWFVLNNSPEVDADILAYREKSPDNVETNFPAWFNHKVNTLDILPWRKTHSRPETGEFKTQKNLKRYVSNLTRYIL
ncbi:CACTA En/Spm transposon protein [Tanacetum coccineum]